jgi:hypothetical protein
MNLETDEQLRARLTHLCPAGHSYAFRDIENASGDRLDHIAKGYGTERKNLSENQQLV